MDEKFLKLFEYLSEHHSKMAEDIIESYEFFASYIKDAEEKLCDECAKAITSHSSNRDDLYTISSLASEIRSRLESNVKALYETFNKEISNTDNNPPIDNPNETNSESQDQDNWKSLDYNFQSEKVICIRFNGQEYNTKDLTDALVKLCEILYTVDNYKFKELINQDFSHGRTRDYFSVNLSEDKYIPILDSGLAVFVNTNNISKIALIKNILTYYGYSHDDIRLLIKSDYSPKPREYKGIKKTADQKIGRYVREKMRLLSKKGYSFDKEELQALQNKKLTKRLVGITYPLLVSRRDMTTGKAQKEKYWNEIFVYNNQEFYVASRWKPEMRKNFDIWYKNLKS